jgi:hypothetical protein
MIKILRVSIACCRISMRGIAPYFAPDGTLDFGDQRSNLPTDHPIFEIGKAGPFRRAQERPNYKGPLLTHRQVLRSCGQTRTLALRVYYPAAHIARCPQHDIRPYLYHLCCNYPFFRRDSSTDPARLDAKALSGPKPERSHLCCCGRHSACERGSWNVGGLASRRAARRYRLANQGLFLNRFEDAMTHNPAYRIENPVYLADCVAFVVKSN